MRDEPRQDVAKVFRLISLSWFVKVLRDDARVGFWVKIDQSGDR